MIGMHFSTSCIKYIERVIDLIVSCWYRNYYGNLLLRRLYVVCRFLHVTQCDTMMYFKVSIRLSAASIGFMKSLMHVTACALEAAIWVFGFTRL
jgi:hypothetical protein